MTDDEMEAGSLKYSEATLRVLPLTSGRFAVFGSFSNEIGLPLLQIVDETTLPAFLRHASEINNTLVEAEIAPRSSRADEILELV